MTLTTRRRQTHQKVRALLFFVITIVVMVVAGVNLVMNDYVLPYQPTSMTSLKK